MTTTCIIQARMGSERLPGKVLQPILDQPMLYWVVERVKQARLIDAIVVATTDHPGDEAIANLCQRHGWRCFRGSENDVLDRYYRASADADRIVRITSDCPVIDPQVIDYVVAGYHAAAPPVDYASNTMTRTYPRGLDVEVFSRSALVQAWQDDQNPGWREHVTPYIYRHPERFRLLDITNPVDYSGYRLTVDTPQDLALIRRIYEHFQTADFSWQAVIEVLETHPDWAAINRDVPQKPVS
jgi:spore coat polysaccharide biosynthesis protein SpsF